MKEAVRKRFEDAASAYRAKLDSSSQDHKHWINAFEPMSVHFGNMLLPVKFQLLSHAGFVELEIWCMTTVSHMWTHMEEYRLLVTVALRPARSRWI